MPNTESAKKRLRQSHVRRARNRAAKSVLKTEVRKLTEAITAGDLEKTEAQFRLVTKRLDRAAAANVIHKNMAGRVKSRLSARVKAAKQKTAAAS